MHPTRYLVSAALAAATTYLLDPVSGRRRRVRLRQKAVKTARDLQEAAGVAVRDLGHRSRGLVARTRARVVRDDGGDDTTICERIRSAIGRVVSHPGVIDVQVLGGRAIVSGAVLADEHDRLIDAVRASRGVDEVEDYTTVYQSADGIPELQGGRHREARPAFLREHWSPGLRLLAGGVGGAMLLGSLRVRGLMRVAELAGGALLLARSVVNRPLKQMAAPSRHGRIVISKSIRVNAPVEQVFTTLANYTNFPRFMRNVREVTQSENGKSHWVVSGPAGVPVEWDSITTRYEANRVLAWRTVPRSTVDHAGVIRFEPDNGGTRLDLRMSYSPPAGALGHVVAQLFGSDPKTEMDEDLLRLKTYLETGQPPPDAAQPQQATRTERPH